MSDWADVVDAVATDLTANVATLTALGADLEIHKLEPWDPEELQSDGKKHIGIWPVGEGAEVPEVLAAGSHQLNQAFAVLYWEPVGVESSRLVRDEDAARALMDLHNAMRARFYVEANQQRAGAFRVWYSGASFPERVGNVRFFAIGFTAAKAISFT